MSHLNTLKAKLGNHKRKEEIAAHSLSAHNTAEGRLPWAGTEKDMLQVKGGEVIELNHNGLGHGGRALSTCLASTKTKTT
jgi:hypothetical protein